jgi:demethylmenaquinone methyltransferase/2-methoxy-6-polyprenyl-1,4-benzoquinol methylase
MELPFADESFDTVTISFGLRNVPDVQAVLAQMLRVTRPGGRLVVCEFSTPAGPLLRAPYEAYLRTVLPAMAKAVVSQADAYTYLVESIRAWPDQMGLARHIQAAGWHKVAYRNLSGGIAALHRATRPA